MVPRKLVGLTVVVARVELAQPVNNAVLESVLVHQIVSDVSVEAMAVALILVEDVRPPKLVSMDNVLDKPFPIVQEELAEVTVLEEFAVLVLWVKSAEMDFVSVPMIVMIGIVETQCNLWEQVWLYVLFNHVELVRLVTLVVLRDCVPPFKVVLWIFKFLNVRQITWSPQLAPQHGLWEGMWPHKLLLPILGHGKYQQMVMEPTQPR